MSDTNEVQAAARRLTGRRLESLGFKRKKCEVECYAIGKPHATLYLFEGYQPDNNTPHDWWACIAKHMQPDEAAARCAHFDRRLKTVDDITALAAALGIELKEKA